jgi:hypothetical protein
MPWIDTIATWFAPAPPPPRQKTQGPRRRSAPPSRQQYRRGQTRSRPNQPANRRRRTSAGQQVIAYHGTPAAANAASIIKHGFMVKSGNALGDGVYLSQSLQEAKGYTGTIGVYLRCRVYLGRSAQWTPQLRNDYQLWCRERSVEVNNSAITGFLRQRGFSTLTSGNIIVVLWPQSANPSAWKRKFREISIISVHRALDDARIRV